MARPSAMPRARLARLRRRAAAAEPKGSAARRATPLSSATATQCMRPPRRLPRPRTRKSALPGGHSYRLSSGKSTAPARCRAPCLQNQPNGDVSARNSRSALPWPVHARSRESASRSTATERRQQRYEGRRAAELSPAPARLKPSARARPAGCVCCFTSPTRSRERKSCSRANTQPAAAKPGVDGSSF